MFFTASSLISKATAEADYPKRMPSIVTFPQPQPISRNVPPFGNGKCSINQFVPKNISGEKTFGRTLYFRSLTIVICSSISSFYFTFNKVRSIICCLKF